MARKKFTDRRIKSLKPKAKRYIEWEDNAHGLGTLGVRVSPAGRRAWIYSYRFEGRFRMLTLGQYPKMTVAAAHEAVGRAMRKLLEEGNDPGAEKVEENQAIRLASSVSELCDEYMVKWAKPRKRSWAEDQRIIEREIKPTIGRRKAIRITRQDIIGMLDCIVRRGAPIQANRTLALIRKVYNFGIERDLVTANPCHILRAPARESSRERFLDDEEIRNFLAVLPGAPMSDQIRLALQLQLLTGQRGCEVLTAEWKENDLDSGWWSIPGSKAKNGQPNRVPLSRQAVQILLQARPMSAGLGMGHVFPSRRGDRPMTTTVLSRALMRSQEEFGGEPFTSHDLRRTTATGMGSLGTSRLVIDKILNHAERGVVKVYDRYSYDKEKREALDAWGLKVESLMPQGAGLRIIRPPVECDAKKNRHA